MNAVPGAREPAVPKSVARSASALPLPLDIERVRLIKGYCTNMLARLLIGLLGVCAQAEGDVESESVAVAAVATDQTELTPETFPEMRGTYFIKFHSPYCGHCKALAPKWDNAVARITEFDKAERGFTWASVNCAEYGDLCSQCDIKAYPSLRVYRDGKEVYQYEHKGTTEENLVAFGKNYIYLGDAAFSNEFEVEGSDLLNDPKIRLAPTAPLLDEADFEKKLEKARVVLFSGAEPVDLSGLRTAMREYGSESVDYAQVLCAQDVPLCTSQGVSAYPTLKVYDASGDVFAYAGALSPKKLVKFFTFCLGAPKPVNLHKPAIDDAQARREKTEQALARAKAKAHQAANGGADGAAPADGDDGDNFRQEFDVKKDPKLDPKADLRKMQEKPKDTTEDVEAAQNEAKKPADNGAAADAFEVAGVPIRYQGQSKALSHADGSVTELTDALFVQAKASGEPWLIAFYSPQCPHCRNMVAEYERAAVLGQGSLNVGRLNCAEFPRVCDAEGVEYFPLVQVISGTHKTKPFAGDRVAEAFVEYARNANKVTIETVLNEGALRELVTTNFNEGVISLLYLYDASVSSEDWDELAAASIALSEHGFRVLSTNSAAVRDAARVPFTGPALVRVGLDGDALTFSLYPVALLGSSSISAANVETWALREKYLTLQRLDPVEQTRRAQYVALVVLPNLHALSQQPLARAANTLAEMFRAETAARTTAFFATLRAELAGESSLAADDIVHAALERCAEADMAQRIAFAFVSRDVWEDNYAKYFRPEDATTDFLLIDFYNGVYVSDVNEKSLTIEMGEVTTGLSLLDERARGLKPANVRPMLSRPRVPRPLILGAAPHSPVRRFFVISLCVGALFMLVYRPLVRRRVHGRRRIVPV